MLILPFSPLPAIRGVMLSAASAKKSDVGVARRAADAFFSMLLERAILGASTGADNTGSDDADDDFDLRTSSAVVRTWAGGGSQELGHAL